MSLDKKIEGPLDGTLFGEGQPCFGCGPDHPSGFRLKFTEEGDELITRFTPGENYQGPPGILHGGLALTLADELAAWVLIARLGKFGFTARVNAKLLKPLRIGVEILGRARLVKSTGRTAEVHLQLSQNELECFRAELTFALLDRGAAEKMLGRALPEAWVKFSR